MLEHVRDTTDYSVSESNHIPGVTTNSWLIWLFVLSIGFYFKGTKGE